MVLSSVVSTVTFRISLSITLMLPCGKGGKCFLTLLFRSFNLMVIKVLPYRRSIHVTEVFEKLKESLGDEEFSRLFQAIITDNGSEFSDPESIEISTKTGEKPIHSIHFA